MFLKFFFRQFLYILIISSAAIWAFLKGLFTQENLLLFWNWVKVNPVEKIIDIVGILLTLELLVRLIRFWYLEHQAKHYVYMRVELARQDSKVDQEKRTEKDFKEKVSLMQQLYRAVFEISELNIWNIIKTSIWKNDLISFEMFLKNKELHFYVVTLPYYQSLVEKQITSFYPQANVITETKPYILRPRGNKANGFYFHLKKRFEYPIKMYDTMEHDPLNDLANVLSKLEDEETAAYQILCHPISDSEWRQKTEDFGTQVFKNKMDDKWWHHIPIFGPIFKFIQAIFSDSAAKNFAPGANSGDSFVRMLQPKEESAKHIGEKAGESGFEVSIRVIATAKTQEKAMDILNSMITAMNVFKDSYANWFEGRRIIIINWINAILMQHGFQRRLPQFFNKTSILCSKELASLYHFPDAHYNQIPVIKWMDYKVLPPPTNLPTEGVLLGYNVFRSQKVPVYISEKDRSRHFYILGKSGSGKSVELSYMAKQDAKNGNGFCVIDPHGDLVEDVLKTIPKERVKDVVVFNPGDRERPMGLNILEAKTDAEKDRASLDAMEIFIKLFGNEVFGPRIQHYFRNACLTLMDDEEEGATLIDVPRMFIDEEFQKRKVAKCRNVVVRQFWEGEIAKTGQREKEEMIPYFSAKFGPFVTNSTMRNIIGQPKSAFNIREIMDSGKILLVNLSKGLIGDINAQLLGLIMVNKISMAAMSRADMDEKDRRSFYLYVDEFQNFATDAFADILSEARKYKLALIMAHQYIAQLTQGSGGPGAGKDSKIKDAVFGNVGTMMTFKIGAEDGEYFEKEYAPA
ncbi:MAG TPA: type IV secretion system DNA-binding domain-containing protein, partial [Candidatus Gracilibacteria bacterium]|nr:type IV secretion system DNA-binding domain-containing protein [Candidatus Gracilibacteria bacterium]